MANGYDVRDAMPDVGYDATVDAEEVAADVAEKVGIIRDDPKAIADLKQRLADSDRLAQELGLGDWSTGNEETYEAKKQDQGRYAQVPVDIDDKTLGEKIAEALNLGKSVISDAEASTTPAGVANQKTYDETISIWDRIKDIDMYDVYGYPVDVVTEILNMALPKDWEIDRPVGGSEEIRDRLAPQLSAGATALVNTVKELDEKLAGNIDVIAKVIGYPVDIVTKILEVAISPLSPIKIDKPVGGSEWYKGLFTDDEEGAADGANVTDVADTTVPGEEIVVEKTDTGETDNKYIKNFINQQKDILETAAALEKDWRSKYDAAKKKTGNSIKAHLTKEVQTAAKLMNAYRNTDEYSKAYGIVNPSFLGKLSEKLPVVAFAKRAEEYLRARDMYTKITGEELLNFVKQGIKEGVPYHLRDRGDPSRDSDIVAFKSMYPAASSLSDEEILYLINNPEALRAWLETIENADQEG